MGRTASKRQIDDGLMIRAAWLHYAGGLTQAEVALRLGLSTIKAHRLIAQANQSGSVKVTIDGDVAECAMLEARLAERFGLRQCEVLPDLGEGGLPLRALGIGGAAYLRRQIEMLQGKTIGIGHGRTLSAVISALPRLSAGATRFVSLLGGLTRHYAANPHDVAHRLAAKTGAETYVMPVPFFANTAADRDILLSQRGVREVFDLARSADLMLVGIGSARSDSQLVASGMIDASELAEVIGRGGTGEVLGHFFDRVGRPVDTSLGTRTISPDLDAIAARKVVAIAGGDEKVRALEAVLRSGLLNGLITDERTALELADGEPF